MNYLDKLKGSIIRILRKAERYTKTDMIYVARGGFWSFLWQGVQILTSFIVVLVLTNNLSKEDFGQYRFLLSIISLLAIFTLTGIDAAITRSVARGETPFFPRIIKEKIRWGIVGSFIALLLSFVYYQKDFLFYAKSLIVIAFFLPFFQTFSIYSSYYKGKQDFRSATIYDSLSKIFISVFIIVVAFLTKNVFLILCVFLITQLIVYSYFYKKMLKNIVWDRNADTSVKEVIAYGKRLSVVTAIEVLMANVDKLLIGQFLGANALAIYYVALTIPNNLVSLFNIVPRIALPKLARNSWERFSFKEIILKLFPMFFVLLIFAIIYIFLVPIFIPLIFKNYDNSVSIAIIFSVFIIVGPLYAMILQVLQARKWVKEIIFLQLLMFVLFLLIFFINYKSLDVKGAAIAFILSKVAAFFVGLFFIKSRNLIVKR